GPAVRGEVGFAQPGDERDFPPGGQFPDAGGAVPGGGHREPAVARYVDVYDGMRVAGPLDGRLPGPGVPDVDQAALPRGGNPHPVEAGGERLRPGVMTLRLDHLLAGGDVPGEHPVVPTAGEQSPAVGREADHADAGKGSAAGELPLVVADAADLLASGQV